MGESYLDQSQADSSQAEVARFMNDFKPFNPDEKDESSQKFENLMESETRTVEVS